MERRRWFRQGGGLSLMALCGPALAMSHPGRRLAVIGMGAGGSCLVEHLAREHDESELFVALRWPRSKADNATASICVAASKVEKPSDVLLVVCLGDHFAGARAQSLAEDLALRGHRVHLFATLPFPFEGGLRRLQAMVFAGQLSKHVHTLYALHLAVLLEASALDPLRSSVLDEVGHRLFELHLRLSSRRHATVV